NPSGAITGGSREQTAGILSRKLEIDKLSKQVSEDAKALQLLKQEICRIREELNAIQNKIESLNEETAKQNLTAVRVEDEVRYTDSVIQKLQSRLREITEQERDGISQQRAILAQLETELAEAEKEYTAALQCEAEAQDVVRTTQAKLDEAKAASADLQAQLAQSKERLVTAQLALARAENSVEQIRTELSQKREELSNLKSVVELEKRVDELKQEAARLRTAALSAEEEMKAKHGQRAEALQALSLLSLLIKEMEERRSAVVEKLHRLEVKEASLRSDLAHAETKLLEEYQIDPDDAVDSLPTPERGASIEAQRLRAEIASMGAVNLGAVEEYNRIRERIDFLTTQRRDLEDAEARLLQIIAEIDETTKETFYATYRRIEAAFEAMFQRLFGGGRTQLVITDPNNLLETGIDIIVQPPGKKLQNIQLLSGGEKALTAVALLFALLEVKPSPFCLLDEVDAALDDANVERFAQVVKEFSSRSQFIIITHNKTTMSAADTLCGVTMEEPGVSKVISIKLEDYTP
ncbi:MAG: AAA family ATPase, partial [Armatimonadota bacterium]